MTAVSGFPKPGTTYNIDNIIKGQIGDDAYFIARHVDEWSNPDFEVSPEPSCSSRETLDTEQSKGNADVIGVADGVGGMC